MGEKKSPAFQFYPTDWLADGNVSAMSLEEEGAYIRLLSYCWNEGGLPSDLKVLARFCRTTEEHFMEMWERIQKCFVFDGKKFQNPRLKKEREKQKKYSESMSKNAKTRYQKEKPDAAAAVPKQCRNDAFQSPSSSSFSNTPPTPTGECESFENFWKEYPKKQGKDKAQTIWRREGLDAIAPVIIDAVQRAASSSQWQDAKFFRYIPTPATFLEEKRWTDQFEPDSKQQKPEFKHPALAAWEKGMPLLCAFDDVVYEAHEIQPCNPVGKVEGVKDLTGFRLSNGDIVSFGHFKPIEG